MSMLRKYMRDSSHVLEFIPLDIKEDLMYNEDPIKILDHKEQVLHSKTVHYVKVLWCNHSVEEATWEGEADMKAKYPHLFHGQGMII